ncbi:MAG: hypothetical protein U1E65_21975 [Myxococcota bacterium]
MKGAEGRGGLVAGFPEISAEEWEAIVERLVRRAAKLVWNGRWEGVRPKAKPWVAERSLELVQATITDVLTEVRPWNRDRYPRFEDALMAALESKASDAKTGAENRLARATSKFVSPDSAIPSGHPSPESRLADAEVVAKIMDATSDDPKLRELAEGVLAGFRPREIVELLGISPDDYDARRLRLRRRLVKEGITIKYLIDLQRGEA